MKTLARLAASAAHRAGRETSDTAVEDALGLAVLSLMVAAVFAMTSLT
ncbi:hypothetical protein [Albimonas pacifica]|uniref:Uncharacterized protein n=1 Tax=Albimonas pacifica TaxID=1114924 RepID=A0A1I3D550_9RHOB|nr:hypothetical protein [Albimonas pacifica]SFH81669.1 hypothetical protein SAMN05216258_102385 [Albimonas pacifica]